jgi:hypothetical protein
VELEGRSKARITILVAGLGNAGTLPALFELGESENRRRDADTTSESAHINAAAVWHPSQVARTPALPAQAQRGAQQDSFAALTQALAARVAEAHSVAPVVMVDS